MSTNINDPWNRGDDPLGDIASAIGKFREVTGDRDPTIYITENCPFYKEIINALDFKDAPTVIVIKGSSVGRSEYINVGTPGHCNYNFNEFEKEILHIVSDKYDIPVKLLERQPPNLLMVNDEFGDLCRSVQDDARRYMVAPEPVLVKSNNKPWYQDRKHFKSKKSRRKNG